MDEAVVVVAAVPVAADRAGAFQWAIELTAGKMVMALSITCQNGRAVAGAMMSRRRVAAVIARATAGDPNETSQRQHIIELMMPMHMPLTSCASPTAHSTDSLQLVLLSCSVVGSG